MVKAIAARTSVSGGRAGRGTIGTIVIEDTYWRASPWRSAQALIAAASSSGRSSGEWWPARPWRDTSRPAMFSSHQSTAFWSVMAPGPGSNAASSLGTSGWRPARRRNVQRGGRRRAVADGVAAGRLGRAPGVVGRGCPAFEGDPTEAVRLAERDTGRRAARHHVPGLARSRPGGHPTRPVAASKVKRTGVTCGVPSGRRVVRVAEWARVRNARVAAKSSTFAHFFFTPSFQISLAMFGFTAVVMTPMAVRTYRRSSSSRSMLAARSARAVKTPSALVSAVW